MRNCGGGVGIATSFAVAGLASWVPSRRQHAQAAGSAAAVYAVTSLAMLVLQLLVVAPGAELQQVVCLSASALAGVARFAVLRLVVFVREHPQDAVTVRAAAPAAPAVLFPAA
ncbi:hypothetical protein [Streptomyces lincolnensis]|uniref:hypothetical protein n=1 Tax=Streptomyces lincolnensis TaxID=1915 RepID=UPI0037D6FEE3